MSTVLCGSVTCSHTFRCAVLIGLAGCGRLFTPEILTTVGENCTHQRPIIMPMSNPTVKMECTAEQAQQFTKGRAIFASGSPQDDVTYEGKLIASSQANNMCAPPSLARIVVARCSSWRGS